MGLSEYSTNICYQVNDENFPPNNQNRYSDESMNRYSDMFSINNLCNLKKDEILYYISQNVIYLKLIIYHIIYNRVYNLMSICIDFINNNPKYKKAYSYGLAICLVKNDIKLFNYLVKRINDESIDYNYIIQYTKHYSNNKKLIKCLEKKYHKSIY